MRKQILLDKMEQVMPWSEVLALIDPLRQAETTIRAMLDFRKSLINSTFNKVL